MKGKAFVNLWRRGDEFHLSHLYNTAAEAKAGEDVAPDAGWAFVQTFPVDTTYRVRVATRVPKAR